MPDYSKRTGYAPWSLTREAGVQSATVNGTIDVPQTCQPTINTGVIDEKGNWKGIKADDEVFIGLTKEEGIADGGTVLFPNTNAFPSIDMTGFSSVAIAIKTTRNGNYAFDLIMECKQMSKQIDLSNIILDNMSIDEKEMLITIIESIRSLEFEVIEEPYLIPKARA